MILRALALTLAFTAAAQAQAQRPPAADAAFQKFVAALWPDAQAKGITRQTFNLAFAGVTPDPRVIGLTTRQPEQAKPMGAYVASLASPQRAAMGVRKEAEWRGLFDAVEKRFKVERWVILAIWGMETSYGALKDKWDTVRSLATLALRQVPRSVFSRRAPDRAENPAGRAHVARQIRQLLGRRDGPDPVHAEEFHPTTPSTSTATASATSGAMCRTRSARPEIISARKAGSTACPGASRSPIPPGFDYRKSRAAFDEWTKLGVKRADGKAYPPGGEGILFFPTGVPGPGFIITENYHVLREYNNSDAYAISIGHLADRMRGGAPFKTPGRRRTPRCRATTASPCRSGSPRLGYDVKLFNGPITFEQRDFIRAEQVKLGMLPDGHASAALLDKMGIKRQVRRGRG